jgi:tripartite-type tricarboxylate transporter receptor subunit TctC
MFKVSRLAGVLAISAIGLAVGAEGAMAQAYPTKPVRIVVPYAPGGATDIVGRIIGEEMRKTLGQPFIVESKVGGNGIVALEEMLRNKDGYTLMVGNVTTNSIWPVIQGAKLRFDYSKEVVAIQRLADVPAVLVVTTTNFPPQNFKDMIAYAKANPGKLRYGTVGAGSYPHFDMEYLGKLAGGMDMNAIHNKAGAAGVINDLVTGDSQAAFLNAASTIAMVKAGKIKAVAVVSPKRLEMYPDVPTMAEVGYPDAGTLAWQTLFAPAATPKPILDALFKASTDALETPDAKDRFAKQNFIVVPNKSLEDSAKWLANDLARWKKITSEVKVELD